MKILTFGKFEKRYVQGPNSGRTLVFLTRRRFRKTDENPHFWKIRKVECVKTKNMSGPPDFDQISYKFLFFPNLLFSPPALFSNVIIHVSSFILDKL
jgi:hypothetical protein